MHELIRNFHDLTSMSTSTLCVIKTSVQSTFSINYFLFPSHPDSFTNHCSFLADSTTSAVSSGNICRCKNLFFASSLLTLLPRELFYNSAATPSKKIFTNLGAVPHLCLSPCLSTTATHISIHTNTCTPLFMKTLYAQQNFPLNHRTKSFALASLLTLPHGVSGSINNKLVNNFFYCTYTYLSYYKNRICTNSIRSKTMLPLSEFGSHFPYQPLSYV